MKIFYLVRLLDPLEIRTLVTLSSEYSQRTVSQSLNQEL